MPENPSWYFVGKKLYFFERRFIFGSPCQESSKSVSHLALGGELRRKTAHRVGYQPNSLKYYPPCCQIAPYKGGNISIPTIPYQITIGNISGFQDRPVQGGIFQGGGGYFMEISWSLVFLGFGCLVKNHIFFENV